MAETKTAEQLADEQRRDVMAYAYKEKDGKLYTIDAKGHRVAAAMDAKPLASEFQTMADQVAALLMMQTKVLTVSPEERTIITQIMEGNAKDRAKLGKDAINAVKNVAEVFGYSYSPEEGTFSSIASGFRAPFVAVKDIWNATGDILNQIGGGELSRENALAFGTAYASARQVAKEERPHDASAWDYTKASFSKNFFAYLVAAFQFGFDKIKGLCGLECSNKTFDQYLDEQMRPADNRRVLHEITKLPRIGDLNTRETGEMLTRDGTARGVDGQRLTVTAANAENVAPQATAPDGTAAPQTPDAAEAARNAQRKNLLARVGGAAKNADFANLRTTIENTDPLWLGVGTAAALGATAQGVRGTVEGLRRQEAKSAFRASDAAEKAHDKAQQKVAEAKETLAKHAGADTAKTAKLNSKLEDALASEARANARAEKAAAAIEKRTPEAIEKATAAAQKIEGGFLKTMTINLPRHIGRGLGDILGLSHYLADKAIGWSNTKDAEVLAKVQAHNAEVFAKAAEGSSHYATKALNGLKVVAKFGRGIPLVGALLGGGVMVFSGSARADTVEGKKLTYFAQLDHDRELGSITAKEYAYYRGLQTAYVAAGAGGVVTAGVTEAAQNGLEYADPVKMDKYLPESLAATVKNLMGHEKPTGALPADPALAAAAVAATQKARAEAVAQAAPAASRGVVFSKVNSSERVGTVPPQATPQPGARAGARPVATPAA